MDDFVLTPFAIIRLTCSFRIFFFLLLFTGGEKSARNDSESKSRSESADENENKTETPIDDSIEIQFHVFIYTTLLQCLHNFSVCM